jgi:hypothetical protein
LRPLGLVAIAASAFACAGHDDGQEPDGPEPLGQVTQAAGTVEDALGAGCSTTSVKGLSVQIVAMMNCVHANAMAQVPDLGNLNMGGAVFPYLQTSARDHLVDAVKSKPGSTLNVSSMLRTVAQQYLLYAWYKAGQCGIPLAATPGNSNHESGLAFDTGDYSSWRTTLEAHGFKWYGSSDVYHFDYTGGGAQNLKGEDVRAFQKLWNQHNPGDKIDEDGAYGPQTEARLRKSPADGWPGGVDCGNPPPKDSGVPDTNPPPPDTGAHDVKSDPVQDKVQPPIDSSPASDVGTGKDGGLPPLPDAPSGGDAPAQDTGGFGPQPGPGGTPAAQIEAVEESGGCAVSGTRAASSSGAAPPGLLLALGLAALARTKTRGRSPTQSRRAN